MRKVILRLLGDLLGGILSFSLIADSSKLPKEAVIKSLADSTQSKRMKNRYQFDGKI